MTISIQHYWKRRQIVHATNYMSHERHDDSSTQEKDAHKLILLAASILFVGSLFGNHSLIHEANANANI